MSFIIIGIDPGSHGAISFVSLDGKFRKVYGFSKYTMYDIRNIITELRDILGYRINDMKAYIEEVHAMPRDGKVQAFSFGKNYGFWIGLLTGLEVPYQTVIPLKWQNGLRLKVRGLEYKQKKNELKANAQRLFPNLSPTLETCDALLIGEYGRQITLQEMRAARNE